MGRDLGRSWVSAVIGWKPVPGLSERSTCGLSWVGPGGQEMLPDPRLPFSRGWVPAGPGRP